MRMQLHLHAHISGYAYPDMTGTVPVRYRYDMTKILTCGVTAANSVLVLFCLSVVVYTVYIPECCILSLTYSKLWHRHP